MAQLDVGTQFAGYRIESLVGRGGMGVVYRARQLDLGRSVALKVIAPEALEDEAARRRFVSEARHAASIEHPNVVPIYSAGEMDGMAYFAMRFVEGDDLRTRVRRDGPLPPLAAAAVLQSAAAALDAIHAAGLVHRDVKPANILLTVEDHVYLTDFGLAREALARGGTSTGTGRWAGSLHYAAPEQIRGGRVDARADVYALGGVLVFMLTGTVPFDRDSDEATLWAHVADPPPRPSQLRRGLPGGFDAVVARAMAKSPDDRYASAGDLGRAALASAHGRRQPRRRGMVAKGAASPAGALALPGLSDEAPTLSGAALSPSPGRAPSRRAVILGAGAAAAVLVAGVAGLVAMLGHDPRGAAHGASTATAATATPAATSTARRGPHVAARFAHVGRRPNALLLVGGKLWVTSATEKRITRLDAMTGRDRAKDPEIGEGGRDLALRRGRVWEANGYADEAVAIDAASRRVLLRIPVPGSAVAVAPARDGSVWVASHAGVPGAPDMVGHYDAKGHQLAQIPVVRGVSAIQLGGGSLWVAVTRIARIMRVNPQTARPVGSTRLELAAGALAWGAGYLWATSPNDSTLYRVTPRTGRPVHTTAGQRPKQVAVTGGRVFVASDNDNTLVMIDPRTMKPAGAPLQMPFNPYAVTADARHVWVAGYGNDTIARVDLR